MGAWRGQVDDARLVLDLVRTARGYGAMCASRTQVTGYLKETVDGTERVTGAVLRDLEAGRDLEVRATYVVNATGVWADRVHALADSHPPKLRPSKGIHLVLDRARAVPTISRNL